MLKLLGFLVMALVLLQRCAKGTWYGWLHGCRLWSIVILLGQSTGVVIVFFSWDFPIIYLFDFYDEWWWCLVISNWFFWYSYIMLIMHLVSDNWLNGWGSTTNVVNTWEILWDENRSERINFIQDELWEDLWIIRSVNLDMKCNIVDYWFGKSI